MPELMLKPGWPNSFRRTVPAGKKSRVIVFNRNEPVTVTAAEMKFLETDIGISLFEVERDEKDRPRFVESEAAELTDPTKNVNEPETAGNVAHV